MTSEQSFNPFAGGELLRVAPTTAPQQEIIAAAKMSDEANTAFNEAVALQINGLIDLELLERCFNVLVKRHEILSTTFSTAGDELCLQEPKNCDFSYEDLREYNETAQQQAVQNLLKNIAISPMNLSEGPLFFVWVKHIDTSVYELIIAAHHLVCDGWSFGVLVNELVKIYNNNCVDSALEKAPSFYDYAEEQSATAVKNIDADFWLDSFKQLPPSLDLPLDKNRPATRSFAASRFDYKIEKAIVQQLPKAASSLKSSKVNYVLAAYFSLLYRLTGNEDIVVGLPVAGQAAFDQLSLVGHMVQLIPIRLQFAGDTTFADLVGMVKKEVIRASEHPNFTFGQLLEKFTVDRSRVPIISTIFNIDQPFPPIEFGSAKATASTVPRAAESFELFLNIVPSAEALLIETTYSKALFMEQTISSWLKALESILRSTIQDHNIALNDLQLASEPPTLVQAFNQTGKELKHKDVVSSFTVQREQNPVAVAVISEDTPLTYTQLDNSSSQLAQYLYNNGVREGSIVGVCCQRSSNLLRSTLAILKLGAAYLPLDPDFPEDRLVYMLEDSEAVAVIEDNLAPAGVKNKEIFHTNLDDLDDLSSIDIALPTLQQKDDRLAYTIYTSGSTGKPKGVNIQNIAMINFLESMAEKPGFTNKDRMLAVTTLSFDISVLELFLPLIVGGTTIIANSVDYKDGERLATLIEQHQITVMQATPSTWRLLLASSWATKTDLAQLPLKSLCGGESLPQSLVNELLPHVSELWNMYGPTETTVWSTCKKIDYSDAFIAIGPPIANTQIFILDNNLEPLPISVPGELCIGGTGVTLGYRNRPELNADRFVEHPDFGRIYRTGDSAKIHPSGEIQHLGRMDDQVKLRGYRIELGEIETALANYHGVKQAAVYLWTLSDEDIRIVACCVSEGGKSFEAIKLRKHLRSALPNYMVPQYLINIDSLPLTPNGKIDRRSLPRPEISESSILGTGSLHNDTEKLIATVWADLLKIPEAIGREDNFFELGGHSLLAIESIRRIEIATEVRLELRHIVTERLHALAERLLTVQEHNDQKAERPVALNQNIFRHLTLEQKRLLKRQLETPENTSGIIPLSWQLDGEINLPAFESSISRVLERQTAMRSVISLEGNDYCLVLKHHSDLDIFEKLDFTDKQAPLEEALSIGTELVKKPIKVVGKTLCNIKLFKISEKSHLLMLIAHQLIFDGWSIDIFLSELETYYNAALDDRAASLEALPFQFRDYTEWSSNTLPNTANLQFHRRSLELPGVAQTLFNIHKPKGQCRRRRTMLDKQHLNSLESFCENHKFRIHEVLFSALCIAYKRLTNQEAFCVGLPVPGRYTPDIIGLIGSFVSTLPIEIHIGDNNFVSSTREIKNQLEIFFKHQDLTLAQLLNDTPFENQSFPSFPLVSFGYQDIRTRPLTMAHLTLTQHSIEKQHTEAPMEFWTRVQNDGFLLVFDYDTGQVEEKPIDFLENEIIGIFESLEKLALEDEPSNENSDQPIEKKTFWRRLFN